MKFINVTINQLILPVAETFTKASKPLIHNVVIKFCLLISTFSNHKIEEEE